MKKCQSCGVENKKESAFCKACGEKLLATGEVEFNNGGQAGEILEDNKMVGKGKSGFKGNAKYLIMGIVAVVAVGIIVKGANIFMSPEKKIMRGVYNLAKDEEQKGSVSLSIGGNSRDIPDIVKDMNLEVFYDYNFKNQESKAKGVLSISKQPLVEVISAVDKEAIYIDTVDLYKKPFYINQNTEYAIILEDFNKSLEYLKDAKLKGVNRSSYIDELGNVLDKHTRKESGKIVIDVTSDTLYEIAISLLRVAKDDEKLAEAMYNDIYIIKNNIEKDKYRFESEEFEELFENLDELPSRRDFVETFTEGINAMYKELKSEREYNKEYYSDFNMEIAFDISMLNKIKTVEFNVDVEGVKGTVLLDTEKTFKTKNYKMDSSINLEKIMYTDEAEEIGMEVVRNLSNKVLNNDKIIKYLESSEISRQLKYYFGTTDIREILEVLLEESL